MPNIETILREHVTLQVECIDRLYLQGYVPALQRPNQLAYFLNVHRGNPLPSPALLGQMTERFVRSIHAFAERHGIPIVQFKRGERKDDRTVGRNINRRLLAIERTSHNCAIAPRTFQSVVLPSEKDGKHVPGLRFGDPRTMAILAALCLFLPTHNGFTNRMLRERISVLLEPGPRGYSHGQMTYDLRRLRLKGLILRLPGKHRYVVTPSGRRVALFFSKTFARILRPGLARIDPDLPPDSTDPLATAWRQVDRAVDLQIHEARLTA